MDETERFDWSDQAALVVRRVDPIAVYTNSDGHIVIRQHHADEPVDSVVTIHPEHVYTVIDALQRQVRHALPTKSAVPLLTEFAFALSRSSH